MTDILAVITCRAGSDLGGVYDLLGYMSGAPVPSERLARAMLTARPVLLAQHPQLAEADHMAATTEPDVWPTLLAGWEARFGTHLPVTPMPAAPPHAPRRDDPTQTVAPWTNAEVLALNRFQQRRDVHPFTCGGARDDAKHRAYAEATGQDRGTLIATPNGWTCPVCDYRQNWAHTAMLGAAATPNTASEGPDDA